MKDRKFNNEVNSEKPPIKKSQIKNNETKAVRIDEQYYTIIRKRAFLEDRKIIDIVNEILEDYFKSNN